MIHAGPGTHLIRSDTKSHETRYYTAGNVSKVRISTEVDRQLTAAFRFEIKRFGICFPV